MFTEKLTTNQQETAEDRSRQAVLKSLEGAGLERIDENNISRLELLERESGFNEDSRMIALGITNVIEFLTEHGGIEVSDEEKVEAQGAAILHDIGKSGPADATPEQQLAVVRLFAAESIRDPKMTVQEVVMSDTLREGGDHEMLKYLRDCGVEPEAIMRDFWDMHAQWTRDILEKYPAGLSRRTRIIAGSHHADKDINPYNIPPREIPLEARVIGTLEDYRDYIHALEKRALIAVDKYQANRRRSGSTHEQAISWVQDNLSRGRFKDDSLMHKVLTAIDELGKKDQIFI